MPSIHSKPPMPAFFAVAASCLSRTPTPAVDFLADDLVPRELAAREIRDHTRNAAVAHEEIRAAAHHYERDVLVVAVAHEFAKPSSVSGSTQNCAGPPTRIVYAAKAVRRDGSRRGP